MILFPLSLFRPLGASDRRLSTAGAFPTADPTSALSRSRRSEARSSAPFALTSKEVIPTTPLGRANRTLSFRGTTEGVRPRCVRRGGRDTAPLASPASGSIVRPFDPMRIHAPEEHPAMPAESGLVRLQEEYEDLQDRVTDLDAYVMQASADGEFSPIELAEYRRRRNSTLVQVMEVGRTIGFVSDAVGLAKTVLHAGAVTPWTARQARERSEDRLRLLSQPVTPPNVIPFPEPDHGPRAA